MGVVSWVVIVSCYPEGVGGSSMGGRCVMLPRRRWGGGGGSFMSGPCVLLSSKRWGEMWGGGGGGS